MKDFKKYYLLPASPAEVYKALTYAPTIQLWSGGPAVMSEEPGSEFSLWSGDIVGKNLAFEPGKCIQQQWYFEGHEPPSIVTIKLHPHKQGTQAELLHTNLPDAEYDSFAAGWDEYYFGALQDFYAP